MRVVTFAKMLLIMLLMIQTQGIVRADEAFPRSIITEGCQLKEPVYDYTFDLNGLHSEFGHKIKTEAGEVEFNVCGGLSRGCRDNANATACLTKKDGKKYLLGNSSELNYNNGRMFFTFGNGDDCSGGKPFILYVTLNCDFTIDVQQLNAVQTEDSECVFYISWETPLACLPIPKNLQSNTCSAIDDQTHHTFDLMPLSDWNYRNGYYPIPFATRTLFRLSVLVWKHKSARNHLWIVSDRNGSFFIINVCKPVLYGENAMCPSDSGVCYIAKNATEIKRKYLNYGIAQPKPVFQNGQLIMNFSSNTKCNDRENISSVIYFLCYREAKREMPEFTKQNGCQYEFSWLTSLACNDVKPCTALSPTTGKEYDFNSIAGVYNLSTNGKNYMIGICQGVGSQCSSDDGACELSNSKAISLGKRSSQIYLNETGFPYAIYSSGAACNDTKLWTTKIEFVCSTNMSNQRAEVIENSDCQVVIYFSTILACKEQILCRVKNSNSSIDLTPLMNSVKNYVAVVNETALGLNNSNSVKYYLNVCRPLVSQYGLNCHGGSAACRAVVKESGKPEEEQSLGYPVSSLTMYNSKVQLKYLYGDKCSMDESEKMSARIDFQCSIDSGKGHPVLTSIINKCHYQFEWLTSVICPTEQVDFDTNSCSVKNSRNSKSFNFRDAKFPKNGIIKVDAKPQPFDVDICGANRTAFADYAEGSVKMYFATSGPCGVGGTLNVQIRFVCAQNTTLSTLHD